MKEKLLSLTRKDFRVETMRGTGAGGQKRNKTESKVRITHIATGITATSDFTRDQRKNRGIAFRSICKNPKFLSWLRQTSLRQKSIDELVEDAMKPENIKIEVMKNRRWENELSTP